MWRAWNGREWSEVTRPYAPSSPLPTLDLVTLVVLARVRSWGVASYFLGLALAVGAVAHLPGHAQPDSPVVASALLGIGTGLFLGGSICFALGVRVLRGRWSIDAVLPFVNVLSLSTLVSRGLELPQTTPRIVSEAVITVVFILYFREASFLALALGALALSHVTRLRWLIDGALR